MPGTDAADCGTSVKDVDGRGLIHIAAGSSLPMVLHALVLTDTIALPVVLRASYAVSGTDVCYAATRRRPPSQRRYDRPSLLLWNTALTCPMLSTDVRCDARA
eukprot:3929167-Rhodomonas_salina.5